MYTLLVIIHVIVCTLMIGAILLQSGKGGGLAANFGGASSSADSVIGTRQAGNLLTKASWWGAGIFLFLSLVLSIESTQRRAPKSVLDQAFTQPAAPAPATQAPAGAATGGAAGITMTPEPSTPAPQPSTTPAAPATKKP